MQIFAIALGGALGAVMRFLTSNAVYSVTGRQFPWGTLTVNVLGSLLMGILGTLLINRANISPEMKNAILVGFLGSFTTFSTFSVDSLNLFSQGHAVKAIVYALMSLILCILATWAGALMVRQL